ncbi:hypothetical protein Q8A67_013379 [Cirrhinus molitorella]|uniref:Ig-like domain-containing protein n=1 Tax=Cirrhinus molitorella TaxID=172907 RepID=A0AA88PN08_9TELE|nr:hypothetical protein Q8A67_013379 [Cirrhinus molitorella]
MILMSGLMLLLLQTAACLDRFCRLNQSDPCYAALGHKLSLLMVLDTSEYEMTIQKIINNNKITDPICRVKNGKMKDCDIYSNRPETTVNNRTLIINHVIRADSGNYTVTISNPSGTQTFQGELQVIVEAPIGSVQVSIICSSSGVMRVSCSSEGDQLLYSWTLNGDTLMDGNSSIDLDEGTDGNITCSVKNHINHGQTTISAKPCSVSVVFVLVWCFQMMLLFGLLGGFHIYMRHTSRKKKEAPIGSVQVSIMCSSSGVMRASCSSEGDQLLYSWTLNGDPLMGGNSSIDLDEGTDGNITCSVKNHINHGQTTISVKPCSGLDLFCRLNQSDPCYAALGHKLSLLMGLDTTPIGSVQVSIICSSSGVMRASCSSEGDQLLYSWTLNGDPLMGGNSSIDLDEGTDGNITCSVKNHINHGQTTISVKPCSVSVVFVLVWCFQMMLLFGLLGGFHIYMRDTSGKKLEDQKLRMRRFRERHEHTTEDS